MALDILVVDDEADIRDLVAGVLEDEGYTARTAADSDAALAAIADRRPSLVLLDVFLKGSRLDGLDLLDEIKRRDPSQPVLVISGHGNLDTAVTAIRRGASDFIEKPFEAQRLLLLVTRATETELLRAENETLKAQYGLDEQLSGTSSAINHVRATLKRVAPTGSRVLISGPAGVGKEVAARMLHSWSPRVNAPFVVVSAARMTPERVEEELFGSERPDGSSTPGLLERAHGGTLFLDEIADMPMTTQGKILRVLTDQSFTRVGGQRLVKVDVRVLSSSARTLTDEIDAGRFREDFYYRLNVVPVFIPSLSERRKTFHRWSSISSPDIQPTDGCRHPMWRQMRWRRYRPMIGRVMSASCATSWSGRSFWRPVIVCRALMWICCRLRLSTTPPAPKGVARHRRLWGPLCGKRVKPLNANICGCRYDVFRGTFPALPILSGWSGLPCTAS